jgi:hypothetical protein
MHATRFIFVCEVKQDITVETSGTAVAEGRDPQGMYVSLNLHPSSLPPLDPELWGEVIREAI